MGKKLKLKPMDNPYKYSNIRNHMIESAQYNIEQAEYKKFKLSGEDSTKYDKMRDELKQDSSNYNERVLKNLWVVWNVINKHFTRWKETEIDDMIGYGFLGLMMADRDFKEDKGIKFNTYAHSCVYSQIKYYISNLRDTSFCRGGYDYKIRNYIFKRITRLDDGSLTDTEIYDTIYKEVKANIWKNVTPFIFSNIWNMAITPMKSIDYKVDEDDEGLEIEDTSFIDDTLDGDLVGIVLEYVNDIEHDTKRVVYSEYLDCVLKGEKFSCTKCGERVGITKQQVSYIVHSMNRDIKRMLLHN